MLNPLLEGVVVALLNDIEFTGLYVIFA